MPTLTIPNPKRQQLAWQGIKPGIFAGDFWSSFNIDFDRIPGKAILSERLYAIIDSSDDSDLGLPVAFVRTNADGTDRWWALCGSVWFKSTDTDPESAWAQDGIASSPTDVQDDGVLFNGALISPSGTDLDRLISGAWTNPWYTTLTGAAALSSSAPHPMDVFTNKLLIGDGNFLNTVDDSNVVVDPRLTFPSEFQVTWIRHTTDLSFIGCSNIRGGQGAVFIWDGTSSTYNRYALLNDPTTMAGVVAQGTVYTVTQKGQILWFNGEDFTPLNDDTGSVIQFPGIEAGLAQELTTQNWVHRNGMTPYEDGILINARGMESMPRFNGGLWYLNLKNKNFYPRFSATANTNNGSTAVNDVGHPRPRLPGAIKETTYSQGRFLMGSQCRIGNSTNRTAILASADINSGAQRGYFITPVLNSRTAQARWLRVFANFGKFLNSTDQIVIKYKILDRPVVGFGYLSGEIQDRVSITWVNTTSFTSILTTGRVVGDEVEFYEGDVAGFLAHISALSATPDGSSTITVTIDETLPVSPPTTSASALFDNWVKLGAITDTGIQQKLYSIIKNARWIQFKVELRGGLRHSPYIDSLLVEYSEQAK